MSEYKFSPSEFGNYGDFLAGITKATTARDAKLRLIPKSPAATKSLAVAWKQLQTPEGQALLKSLLACGQNKNKGYRCEDLSGRVATALGAAPASAYVASPRYTRARSAREKAMGRRPQGATQDACEGDGGVWISSGPYADTCRRQNRPAAYGASFKRMFRGKPEACLAAGGSPVNNAVRSCRRPARPRVAAAVRGYDDNPWA